MHQKAPDLLIVGGYVPEIGTAADLDATRTQGRPTAVAVTGARISAVGGDELRALAGPGTTVLDARGGAILPGLNDGHLHFCASAVTRYLLVDLAGAGDWEGILNLIQDAEAGADCWIRAHGWDEAEHGDVPAASFHAVHPQVPVVAYDKTGHQLLVNEAGLRKMGLVQDAPVVSGGTVGRFLDGRPNGRMVDGAMALVNSRLPEFPATALREAFLRHQADLHACGITSLTEPGLGPGGISLLGAASATPSLRVLTDMAADGELTLRITALLLFSGTGGATADATRSGLAGDLPGLASRRGIDPLLLNVAGVKVFADGTPRSGTAWMSQEYQTPCGHGHGHMVIAGNDEAERTAELHAIVAAIHAAGLQAGIHATGDASTAAVVEAIAAAQSGTGVRGRHYVIHGAFADRHQLESLARNSVGYSTNPAIRAEAGALMLRVLGASRFAEQQPLASALRAGVSSTIASDAPVTPFDWRHSIVAAVTRNTSAGPGMEDPERLTLAQALSLMTQAPAWQDGAELHKGSVAPGQLADLCVLAGPLPRDARDLHGLPTATTIAGGRVVFHAERRDRESTYTPSPTTHPSPRTVGA